MKVLQLIQRQQFRGAEVFAAQLATHTEEEGHKVIMIALFPGKMPLPFCGKIIGLGGSIENRYLNIAAWRRLAKIIREEKPDLVQANAGDTLKYAVCSKLLFNWKQPIVFRNASTISLYIKKWFIQKWSAFLFSHVQKIVSVSHACAADFINLFPTCNHKVVVVPIGIEEDKSLVHHTQVRKAVSFPMLLHVGGFSFEKNHHRLLYIFRRLLNQYPNATLCLVGDGPLRKATEDLCIRLQLTEHVHFLGTRQNILQLMQKADALVLPSIIEGLPGVILEAFYCKTPVVAYDVGGIGEVLVNHQTGRLVPKGNEDAFLQAICEMLENKEEQERMLNNAHELVMGNYLNKDITRRFIQVYQSLVQ